MMLGGPRWREGGGGWRRRRGRRLRRGALCAAVDTVGCRPRRASARRR